ncbi:MAG: hypothetical protein ACP5QM_05700 [Caldisericum sp.]|jgi:hypothetical protein|uniref:hypothetical protein n=2 Tax=Caldisericum sp. TaxID=2499687 RepID=UPI003D1039EC
MERKMEIREFLEENILNVVDFAIENFKNGFRVFYILNPSSEFFKKVDGIMYGDRFFVTDNSVSFKVFKDFFPDVLLLFAINDISEFNKQEEVDTEKDKDETLDLLSNMIYEAEKFLNYKNDQI